MMKKIILTLFIALMGSLSFAQGGLLDVIVEPVDATPAGEGLTAYRVYIELEAGFELQQLYGNDEYPLMISTTTSWYNDLSGSVSGDLMNASFFLPPFSDLFPGFPYDSYVSLGAASQTEWGVQLSDDSDGTVDGRMMLGPVNAVSTLGVINIAENFGPAASANTLIADDDGQFFTLSTNADIAPSNRIYVGQFTTDGDFSFAINIQTREAGTANFMTMAALDYPILNYPLVEGGCADPEACNYDDSLEISDDSCVYAEGCDTCSGETDGSGVVVDNPEAGESCDDGDAGTFDDVIGSDCVCAGTPYDCPELMANFGDACDDGDETTINDAVNENCVCMGEPEPCAAVGAAIFTNSETTVCVGDGEDDIVVVEVEDAGVGSNGTLVVTDEDGNILGIPGGFEVNFEDAGLGVCLIWHLNFEDGLVGAEVGANAADLEGCFELSNSIAVTRTDDCLPDCPELGLNIGDACDDGDDSTENDMVNDNCVCMGTPIGCEAVGATIFTNSETTVCVGDGEDDIVVVEVEDAGAGSNGTLVVTDEDGNILGIPGGFDVNFEDAGLGVCLIWHLNYEDDLTGAEVGMNANDLGGCYALSNPISVTRNDDCIFDCPELEANIGDACDDGNDDTINDMVNENCVCMGEPDDTCDAVGATIFTNSETTVCVGDGEADIVVVEVEDAGAGSNGTLVVTDEDGNILGIPGGFEVNFEDAGLGVCLIWHLNFEDGLTGAEVGANAADLEGCYELSNPISVTRTDDCIVDCPELEANIGDACDDGNDATVNDMVTEDCVCVGVETGDCSEVVSSMWGGGPWTNVVQGYFVAENANDAVLARSEGEDVSVEIFDGECGGASLGVYDDAGVNGIERAVAGNLVAGNTYSYVVTGGTNVQSKVKKYAESGLIASDCDATINILDKFYAMRDYEMYSNPSIYVTGYGFHITNTETNESIEIIDASVDGFWQQIVEIPFMSAGNYDVRVRHSVLQMANGAIQSLWSDYGDACGVTVTNEAEVTNDEEFITGVSIDANIYPNPNVGEVVFFELQELSGDDSLMKVNITDAYGKVIVSELSTVSGQTFNGRIDMEQKLSAGMYFITIEVQNQTLTNKIVVQ